MLSARSIFHEIRGNDRAYQLLPSIAAKGEIRVYRRVSLHFIDEIAAILGWSPLKRGVLRLSVEFVYLVERTWTWRRMVRLTPPQRPNALGPMPARATAGASPSAVSREQQLRGMHRSAQPMLRRGDRCA